MVNELVARYAGTFPSADQVAYFKTGTIGLQPVPRTERAVQTVPGSMAWYQQWEQEIHQVQRLYAELIGAEEHEILLAPSVPAALRCIGAALVPPTSILINALDVPSLGRTWAAGPFQEVASQDRVHTTVKSFREEMTETSTLLAVSRVSPASGTIADLAALSAMAHQHGALLLVEDSYGSGAIPLTVTQPLIDILITDTRRWLMGGAGLTLLSVRKGVLRRLAPLLTGAYGIYQRGTPRTPPEQEWMRMNCTAPSRATLQAAIRGLLCIKTIGVTRIWQHLRQQTTQLIEAVQAQEWESPLCQHGDDRGPLLLLHCKHPLAVATTLEHQGILVGWQPGFVDIAPALSTTQADLTRLIQALEQLRPTEGTARS